MMISVSDVARILNWGVAIHGAWKNYQCIQGKGMHGLLGKLVVVKSNHHADQNVVRL